MSDNLCDCSPDCAVPYGLCHCLCGGQTTISPVNDAPKGYYAGKPRLYLKGHANRMTVEQQREKNVIVEDRGYSTHCWIWYGYIDIKGYGRTSYKGKTGFAHRIFFEHYKVKIPKGKDLHHFCNIPACVNPKHLQFIDPSAHTRISVGKLSPQKVIEIRELRQKGWIMREIGELYGVSTSTIENVVHRRFWQDIS